MLLRKKEYLVIDLSRLYCKNICALRSAISKLILPVGQKCWQKTMAACADRGRDQGAKAPKTEQANEHARRTIRIMRWCALCSCRCGALSDARERTYDGRPTPCNVLS